MFLWRKSAEPNWVKAHEDPLQAHGGGQLVIVCGPRHKCLLLEIVWISRSQSRALLKQFGRCVEELPPNWLERFACPPKSEPIKIGKRLVILGSGTFPAQKGFEVGKTTLLMPARMAFGTREHATTAMSLRLLEELTRGWKRGSFWSWPRRGHG